MTHLCNMSKLIGFYLNGCYNALVMPRFTKATVLADAPEESSYE